MSVGRIKPELNSCLIVYHQDIEKVEYKNKSEILLLISSFVSVTEQQLLLFLLLLIVVRLVVIGLNIVSTHGGLTLFCSNGCFMFLLFLLS